MNQEIEIILERRDTVTVFDIRGDVTIFAEPYFDEAYRNANAQGASKFILKFEESAYINSGGIAVLIQMLAETKKNSQHIAVTGLTSHYKKIFNMVGITKFAKVYDTIEEALEAMVGSGL